MSWSSSLSLLLTPLCASFSRKGPFLIITTLLVFGTEQPLDKVSHQDMWLHSAHVTQRPQVAESETKAFTAKKATCRTLQGLHILEVSSHCWLEKSGWREVMWLYVCGLHWTDHMWTWAQGLGLDPVTCSVCISWETHLAEPKSQKDDSWHVVLLALSMVAWTWGSLDVFDQNALSIHWTTQNSALPSEPMQGMQVRKTSTDVG